MIFLDDFSADIDSADGHVIDIVEAMAQSHDWRISRMSDDRITLEIGGLWRSYALTLAFFPHEQVLRMVCSFVMDPPGDRLMALYETLNLANARCDIGAFSYILAEKQMVWRYTLSLTDRGNDIGVLDEFMSAAVICAERFYPAFQLAIWGDKAPQEAVQFAFLEAHGQA